MTNPKSSRIEEIVSRARARGCQHVLFYNESGLFGLSLVWKGKTYEQTFTVNEATDGERWELMLTELERSIDRLVDGTPEAA